MKQVIVWYFLLAGLLTASAQNALSKLESTRLFGRDYIRLTDWAQAYKFEYSRPPGSDEARLTSQWSKLIFTVDSQKAEINGVMVYLSAPIASSGNTVYIALLDLQTAVHPVIFQPKRARGSPIKRVCLDPGHGGKDPGNEEGRRREKEYTLWLAREVKQRLTDAGLQVALTRNTDTFVALPDRNEYARRQDADLFVSLHFNAAQTDKNQVKGVEVYCMTPMGANSTNSRGETADTTADKGNRHDADNMLLAYQIQKAMIKNLPVEDRGVKHARFAVLRNADMPAALVEAGFMSHPQESKRIFDSEYRGQLARAIANGILAYKRLVEQ